MRPVHFTRVCNGNAEIKQIGAWKKSHRDSVGDYLATVLGLPNEQLLAGVAN